MPRPSKAKDMGQRGQSIWQIEAETYRQQSSYPRKLLVLQRIRLAELRGITLRSDEMKARLDKTEYRIGYYIVARNGKWVWGQFAPFIPEADFTALIEKARQEGTLVQPCDDLR